MKLSKNLVRLAAFLLFATATSCRGQEAFTVVDVIQNADRLNGKTIHVRGFAYLWMNPSQAEMWKTGGCIPKTDPSYRQRAVVGWLTLYDSVFPDNWGGDDAPRDKIGVNISESAFRCNGDYCGITCSSFEVVSGRMYEFAGTLQVSEDSQFILDNIDLDRSRQNVEGTWLPISIGNFDVMFP